MRGVSVRHGDGKDWSKVLVFRNDGMNIWKMRGLNWKGKAFGRTEKESHLVKAMSCSGVLRGEAGGKEPNLRVTRPHAHCLLWFLAKIATRLPLRPLSSGSAYGHTCNVTVAVSSVPGSSEQAKIHDAALSGDSKGEREWREWRFFCCLRETFILFYLFLLYIYCFLIYLFLW